jgi:hypothetical protein
MNDIRTLLHDLAGDEPPVAVDLDRQIARGRRRQQTHRLAAAGTSVALVAVLVVGVIALRPGSGAVDDLGAAGRAGAGTPNLPPVSTPRVADLPTDVSTARSKALRAELERLAPELGSLPDARSYDFVWSDGKKPTPHLSAGRAENDSQGGRSRSVAVEVGDRAAGVRVVTVCEKAGTPPPSGPGTPVGCQVRELPDGSIAFISEFTADGGDSTAIARHEVGVRLVRPDNIEVYVGSAQQGSTDAPPLTLARALEIAQALTVTP